MAANFFDNNQDNQESQEEGKIKLGDSEFSAEELQELVGAGRRLKEIEEKQGQPVDDILKSWGRRGEEIGKLKAKVEEYETKTPEPPKTQEAVDREKLKEQVIAEAREFGLLTKEEAKALVEEVYETRRTGERIYAKANKVLRNAKKDGKPSTSIDKLLEFMADPANPKDPEKAYKVMFDRELDDWKQTQLMKLKKPGFTTEATSTAGAKQPVSKIPGDKNELKQALRDYLHASE